jgi:8-oxo-dGTP pyrophosphatase MutT (NUDIX family)
LREVKEETGIANLRFVGGFREEDVYQTVSKRLPYKGSVIEKHSIYFLSETKTKDIVVDTKEITDYKWLGIIDAEKLLVFDSLKRILRKSEVFVHAKTPKNAETTT